mmetsp:Transcript_42592/g.117900  ORF Transcript_42592/g.117900 Transcript_42592/m.117900 type:complete len:221 (-) Transcript_42592:175-837(-)
MAYIPASAVVNPAQASAEVEVDPSDRIAVMLQQFSQEYASGSGLDTESAGVTAQSAYRDADYEKALELFARHLAFSARLGMDPELEASLSSNIGACLHHLGDDELSKKYYTQAISIFETRCYTPRLTWLWYGDINQKRIDFVKARVDALTESKKPASTYLDTSGNERTWEAGAEGSAEGDTGLLAYFNPFAWYRYYATTPAADEPAAQAAASSPAAAEAV